MDALITYGSNRISYSALKSLASLGLDVAAADTVRMGMCQWSRHCRRSYIYADPLKHEEAYINDIVRILRDSGARFLLPGLHDTELLARYRHALPAGVILPLAGPEKIHRANDKGIMAALAREIGVDVPEVLEWKNWDELEKGLREMDGEVVVKLRNGYAARWVYYPENRVEAVNICKGLVERHSLGQDSLPIVQKRVHGESWGVGCLYHEGTMMSSFTYRVLREMPATGGTATVRVSMRNRKLEEYAKRLLDSLNWHGIAMIDFIYDPATKDAWFIEVNPRLWGSISHAVASGIDLVKLLYIASTEGPEKALEMVRPQFDGVVCRWWLGDVLRARSELKDLKIGNAFKFLMPVGADYSDDIKIDDAGATIGEVVSTLWGHFGSKKSKQGLRLGGDAFGKEESGATGPRREGMVKM